MDDDGIWNVAQVLRLPTPDTVEVTYDGWGSEYNEKLKRDSERIAPFHTHTWTVKCWAKMDTWPWWPALVTVRSPQSNEGADNLKHEKRLLVDFLDREDFSERCRCWVEKSKILPFQSDLKSRKKLAGLEKMTRRFKGEARLRNLERSTKLLSACNAREDFPKFVKGTLPMQFIKKNTEPTGKVRKKMGEEKWMRGFADNRIIHAATHAYVPAFPKVRKIDRDIKAMTGDNMVHSTAKGRDLSHDQEKKTFLASETERAESKIVTKMSKSAKAGAHVSAKKKSKILKLDKNRKRSRPMVEDESPDNADTIQAEITENSRELDHITQSNETQLSIGNVENYFEHDGKSKGMVDLEQNHMSPRKSGKTSKVLKSSRKLAAYLPFNTPPYARVLQSGQSGAEQLIDRSSHTERARRALNAKKTNAFDKLIQDAAFESLPITDQQVQQTNFIAKENSYTNAKSVGGPASALKFLARLTNTTLCAEKKVHVMEAALEGKLTELAEKSTKAQQLRRKCAALLIETQRPLNQAQLNLENTLVLSSEATSAAETQKEALFKSSSPGVSQVPTTAKKSLQAKYDIQELELVLDQIISKELAQSLSANPTSAELDAVKVEVLKSSKVQAAIARIEHSCNVTDDFSHRAWEKNTLCLKDYTSKLESFNRKPSLLSPNRQYGTPRKYERTSELGVEDFQNTFTILESSLSNQGDFTFSVNDNFSMNQWYRDLYSKAYEL